VPVVKRGQLVEVVSPAGSIVVRSVAKSAADGSVGDTVELRVGEGRGQTLVGVVTGARQVTVGAAGGGEAVWAMGLSDEK
jgi:flagella basal body P-ring formation protein FlgA